MSIAFAIKGISVKLISQDELAMLIECETDREAQQLDYALDGCSIGIYDKEGDYISLAIRAPRLGSYQLDVKKSVLSQIKKATVLCAAYWNQTGQLEALSPHPLILRLPPN
jgi:hypothetical protein